jgi:cytochrome bd-type quinol oxidase subunit 2
MQKLKQLILTFGATSTLLVSGLMMPVLAHAQIGAQACTGATDAVQGGESGPCTKEDGSDSFTKLVQQIVNIFSLIVGAVSVIMIIYGGFRYITSGGDSNGVTAAKNTILYAVIGLVIVALAQIIIRFVLGATNDATT